MKQIKTSISEDAPLNINVYVHTPTEQDSYNLLSILKTNFKWKDTLITKWKYKEDHVYHVNIDNSKCVDLSYGTKISAYRYNDTITLEEFKERYITNPYRIDNILKNLEKIEEKLKI